MTDGGHKSWCMRLLEAFLVEYKLFSLVFYQILLFTLPYDNSLPDIFRNGIIGGAKSRYTQKCPYQ
jgi:hypothetical protein